ncbi:MADF domain-containing protein [Meloidogyne graminicola]|uniref:MADF domain-containing protein n=1 Tax=Meloidogyne graminicola TaxID=189291 RepID=A0A8S9ZYE5_9BILA|nr:MADF domain-containing protein [Meloidogyne graminicola]
MPPVTIPSCCLTAEQKDILIDAVHKRPVIWDCSIPDYQDVQNRRAAFIEVAEILSDDKSKYSGPEMQVEWKKLRDIFNRTLKKVVANGGGDSEITWRYWQKLQFIADHERTQIYKAMQKWSKKVEQLYPPPSSSSSTNNSKRKSINNNINYNLISSSQNEQNNQQKIFKLISDEKKTSMVQQLAEVAQTARKLLNNEITKKEDNEENDEEEEEKFKIINENGEIIQNNKNKIKEVEEKEKQKILVKNKRRKDINFNERPTIDTIGQMLLNSTYFNNNNNNEDYYIENNNNSTICTTTHEINNKTSDLPKLLNELLTNRETTTENNEIIKLSLNSQIKNGNLKRPRLEDKLKNELKNCCLIEDINKEQKQINNSKSDQFDVFGMFIASQLRTLHGNSPQSAFTLKRALTELCFQFEAEQKEIEEQNK